MMARDQMAAGFWVSMLMAMGVACGGAERPQTLAPARPPASASDAAQNVGQKQAPPASGPARDISFPPIVRSETPSGLEVNVVEWRQLPVVYLRLVVRSGSETDPAELPGLSGLVSAMLKEGTRRRSSSRLAEDVEFLGADLSAGADEENVYVTIRALSEHVDEALDILADVVTQPAFRQDELRKLRARELDRLSLMTQRPEYLAEQAFHRTLYGDHPYAQIDATVDSVKRVKRGDLAKWHRKHFVPSNSFLVVVGNVDASKMQSVAASAFSKWKGKAPEVPEFPAPPVRTKRTIVVVDRPGSVQSVIRVGNLAVPRDDDDWIPLQVSNQVLGGSAASRLFMDLRERRSLTYGAYSRVDDRVQVGPFVAKASVRTEVTEEAVGAFFEHFERIVKEEAPAEELRNAQRFLSDSFPLRIDTPGKIASLVADLRIFGLADDYWDSFRSKIRDVNSAQALAAIRTHVHPDRALLVVVGEAAKIAEGLKRYGEVLVVDAEGKTKSSSEGQRTDASKKPAE